MVEFLFDSLLLRLPRRQESSPLLAVLERDSREPRRFRYSPESTSSTPLSFAASWFRRKFSVPGLSCFLSTRTLCRRMVITFLVNSDSSPVDIADERSRFASELREKP